MSKPKDVSRRAILAGAALVPVMAVGAGAPDRTSRARSNGKVAIVTGASRGIGAATAKRLARDGFAVTVNYDRSADAATALAREIESAGGRAIVVRADGRIITLSSSITQLRTPTYGPYAATKAAQEQYANILAKELAGRMISVNALAPGVVNTPLFTDGKTPQQIAGFAERTPHKRLGEPVDIANVIAALCSDDGAWVNGQTVFANGGIV